MIAGLRQPGLTFHPHAGSLNRPRPDASPANVSYERTVVATAQSHTDAALSITTDEGDSVTISFAEDTEATYGSLVRGQRGPNGSSQVSAYSASLETSSEFKIQVQGDLSEQELKDIQDLVKRVGQALHSFEQGHVQQAARRLSNVGELDSLSGFQVEMNHSESVSVAVSTQRTIGPPAPLSPGILEEGGLQKPPVGAMPISAPPTDDANPLDKSVATPVPVSVPGTEELVGQLLEKALGAGAEQPANDPIVDVFEVPTNV